MSPHNILTLPRCVVLLIGAHLSKPVSQADTAGVKKHSHLRLRNADPRRALDCIHQSIDEIFELTPLLSPFHQRLPLSFQRLPIKPLTRPLVPVV
jgi:hypothetical protein